MVNVYIVAGGPGDPELITLKGQRIIDSADSIFTSYEFISKTMFKNIKPTCKIYDSFKYDYQTKMKIVDREVKKGRIIVFVTMGDPCFYGMIGGLTDRLEKSGIAYEIVPGVSSFNASTAIIKKGMTGLGISNTAICTSYKKDIDSRDYLEKIASLKASVALFMSIKSIAEICDIFKKYYPEDTAVVIVSRASWKEQVLLKGNLSTIVDKLKESEIVDGLILIGDFIDNEYDYEIERKFMERKRLEREKKKREF